MVPGSRAVLGRAAYLGAIATVFGHPGRRFGQLIEALALVLAGTSLGLAWSLFGVYLSSLVIKVDPAAAYSIRGVFLAIALIFHGFLRSKTPRLFIFVLLYIIVSVVSLTSTATAVTSTSVTQILYPILLAAGVILLVNLLLFPEFSSSFLGETTIETLNDTADALRNAGQYFTPLSRSKDALDEVPPSENRYEVASDGDKVQKAITRSMFVRFIHHLRRSKEREPRNAGAPEGSTSKEEPQGISLQDLVATKAKLRSKLSICKAAQTECNFEIAFAVLPPRKLKPISDRSMRRLVANAIAVIGACESKFALLGGENEQDSSTKDVTRGDELESAVDGDKIELDLIKPRREIEFGDVQLFQYLLERIAAPYSRLSIVVSRAIDCVSVGIAYCYDVPKLPPGARAPRGLSIEEVDVYADELSLALISFDADVATALERAVEIPGSERSQLDVMPREELFLIASFLLNLRQAATHVEEMLKHSRSLVLERQSRHDRRRFYAPRIKWSKWLYSGGQEDEALPASGRKRNRLGEEDEKADDEANADPADSEESLIDHAPGGQDLENGPGTRLRSPKLAQPHLQLTAKVTPASSSHKREGFLLRLRGNMADGLEWVQNSDDILYALKLGVAVMLVTWPAFVARWNTWYSLNRGCKSAHPSPP